MLYLIAVGPPYFIRGGMQRDLKNAPPLCLRLSSELLTLSLTLSLSFALFLFLLTTQLGFFQLLFRLV